MSRPVYYQLIEFLFDYSCGVVLRDDVVLYDHAQNRAYLGQAAVEAQLRAFFIGGFPDAQVKVFNAAFDGVFLEATFLLQGIQDGSFSGLPATRRGVSLVMRLCCQVEVNQVTALDLYYDAADLLRQLGLAL
jgi:hypothetical protein